MKDLNQEFATEDKVKVSSRNRASRNKCEKDRRDKLNDYVQELATLVPGCSSFSKKRDKASILKSTAEFMKVHNDLTVSVTGKEANTFLTSDEIGHMLFEASYGFLFVVSRHGNFKYFSQSLENVLGYSKVELLNKDICDYVHPDDKNVILEQLSAKRDEKSSNGCSVFYLRLKSKLEINADQEKYATLRCIGSFKNENNQDNGDKQESSDTGTSEGCFVVLAELSNPNHERNTLFQTKNDDLIFESRQSLNGKFLFVDPRCIKITGYLPYELLGSIMYEFVHCDDLESISQSFESLLEAGEAITPEYRILTKGNQWISIQTTSYVSFNHWNSKPEYICSTHTLSSVDREGNLQKKGSSQQVNQITTAVESIWKEERIKSPATRGGSCKSDGTGVGSNTPVVKETTAACLTQDEEPRSSFLSDFLDAAQSMTKVDNTFDKHGATLRNGTIIDQAQKLTTPGNKLTSDDHAIFSSDGDHYCVGNHVGLASGNTSPYVTPVTSRCSVSHNAPEKRFSPNTTANVMVVPPMQRNPATKKIPEPRSPTGTFGEASWNGRTEFMMQGFPTSDGTQYISDKIYHNTCSPYQKSTQQNPTVGLDLLWQSQSNELACNLTNSYATSHADIRRDNIVCNSQYTSTVPSSNPNYVPSSNPNYVPSSNPNYVPSSNPNYVSSSNPNYVPSSNPNYVPSSNPNYVPSSNAEGAPFYYSTEVQSNNPSATPFYFPNGISSSSGAAFYNPNGVSHSNTDRVQSPNPISLKPNRVSASNPNGALLYNQKGISAPNSNDDNKIGMYVRSPNHGDETFDPTSGHGSPEQIRNYGRPLIENYYQQPPIHNLNDESRTTAPNSSSVTYSINHQVTPDNDNFHHVQGQFPARKMRPMHVSCDVISESNQPSSTYQNPVDNIPLQPSPDQYAGGAPRPNVKPFNPQSQSDLSGDFDLGLQSTKEKFDSEKSNQGNKAIPRFSQVGKVLRTQLLDKQKHLQDMINQQQKQLAKLQNLINLNGQAQFTLPSAINHDENKDLLRRASNLSVQHGKHSMRQQDLHNLLRSNVDKNTLAEGNYVPTYPQDVVSQPHPTLYGDNSLAAEVHSGGSNPMLHRVIAGGTVEEVGNRNTTQTAQIMVVRTTSGHNTVNQPLSSTTSTPTTDYFSKFTTEELQEFITLTAHEPSAAPERETDDKETVVPASYNSLLGRQKQLLEMQEEQRRQLLSRQQEYMMKIEKEQQNQFRNSNTHEVWNEEAQSPAAPQNQYNAPNDHCNDNASYDGIDLGCGKYELTDEDKEIVDMLLAETTGCSLPWTEEMLKVFS